MMFGYIYKTTDTRNGLIYIGQHVSKRFNPFYFGSGRDICQLPYEDRLKYYKVELLHIVEATGNKDNDWALLDKLEIEAIAAYQATNPKIGYNRSKGGQHNAGWHKAVKGRIVMHKGDKIVRIHPEYKQLYLDDGYEYGMSKKAKEKQIMSLRMTFSTTESHLKKRNVQLGKKRTDEMKKHLSEGAKKRWLDKEKNANMYGRKTINDGINVRHVFEEEAKQLVATGKWQYGGIGKKRTIHKTVIYNKEKDISIHVLPEEVESYLVTGKWEHRGRSKSQKQCDMISQMRKGRKWMYKDGMLIQAKPEEVDELLQQGWRLGRK